MSEFSVILPAAGGSTRFTGFAEKKTHIDLLGAPVWQRTAEIFSSRSDVGEVIVVVAPEELADFRDRFSDQLRGLITTAGGATRAHSVQNGLSVSNHAFPFVAVHDAARPLVSSQVIDRAFEAVRMTGAAVPGVPVTSTVKRVDSAGQILATVDRSALRLAQTPQSFSRQVLETAYQQAGAALEQFTDESSLVEAAGHPVTVTEGCWKNIKITTTDDYRLAQMLLSAADSQAGSQP